MLRGDTRKTDESPGTWLIPSGYSAVMYSFVEQHRMDRPLDRAAVRNIKHGVRSSHGAWERLPDGLGLAMMSAGESGVECEQMQPWTVQYTSSRRFDFHRT